MRRSEFGTAINCMDGRTQEPLIHWLKTRYNVYYIDMITEAGPIKYLAEGGEADARILAAIHERLKISIEVHGSRVVAVVGHHDCARNPVKRKVQVEQIKQASELVHSWFPHVEVIGLYVNEIWQVEHLGRVKP